MQRTIGILLLSLIGLGLMRLTPINAEVSHDEIYGNIKSLVYSYGQLDNKLERHEHRERALGELLKKALQALQKGQKNLEPINGIFGRLDERVSQIETMLITQEEKYNTQMDKLGGALEHMFKWMRENDECYKRPPLPPDAAPAGAVAVASVNPEFVAQQQALNKELLTQVQKLSANVEKLLDNSKNMLAQTEVTFKSVPSTAEMLTKIEDKLVSYSVAPPQNVVMAEPVDNSEFEHKVLEKFELLASGIAVLNAAPAPKQGLSSADRDFMQSLNNETLNALQHVKTEAVLATKEALQTNAAQLEQTEKHMDANINKVFDGITDSAKVLQSFYNEMNVSYTKFNEGLDIFNKFNNILMTNSEYVLDTQRKVEFGTLQIVQKVGDMLDKQREEITVLAKERFDKVDESIVSNQMEALQNLSALVESEVSHVWRQIAIMTDELSESKELLNLMQGRNDAYVNTTFHTMDTMSQKVEETKGRMLDMDSNLNFLLGKLSVMSQEFRNIKIGLAESLDQLRNTFHTMQDKMPDKGPGPHNIDNDEYKTEFNLLQKRHAKLI